MTDVVRTVLGKCCKYEISPIPGMLKHWTQKRLAVTFGVARNTVSAWFTSNSNNGNACKPKPGDLLNFGEATYGEVVEEGPYEQKTLYEAKYVSANVPISVRTESLSFGHHKLVAQLPRRQQVTWLKRASRENLTVAQITLMAERRLGEMLKTMPKAKGTAGKGRPRKGGAKKEPPKDNTPTLESQGIDKKLSPAG